MSFDRSSEGLLSAWVAEALAKPGLVALLAATVTAATASLPPTASGPMFLDFVGDTSAGEWLGSRSAFHKQGVDD